VGKEFLKKLNFTPRIQKLVKNHVTAKRYLCRKDPSYYGSLTNASKTTLTFQGGVMTVEEAGEFEKDVDFSVIISMRKWDEEAKVPNKVVPGVESYAQLIDKFSSCDMDMDMNMNCYLLSSEQLKFYSEFGFLKIPNLLMFLGGLTVKTLNHHKQLGVLCNEVIGQISCQLLQQRTVLIKDTLLFDMTTGSSDTGGSGDIVTDVTGSGSGSCGGTDVAQYVDDSGSGSGSGSGCIHAIMVIDTPCIGTGTETGAETGAETETEFVSVSGVESECTKFSFHITTEQRQNENESGNANTPVLCESGHVLFSNTMPRTDSDTRSTNSNASPSSPNCNPHRVISLTYAPL